MSSQQFKMQKPNNQDKDKIIKSLLKQTSQQENAITSLLTLQQRIKTYAIDDLYTGGFLLSQNSIRQRILGNSQINEKANQNNKKYLLVDISQCNQTISFDRKAHITDIDILLANLQLCKQNQPLKKDSLEFKQFQEYCRSIQIQISSIKKQLLAFKTKNIFVPRFQKNKLQAYPIMSQIVSIPSKKAYQIGSEVYLNQNKSIKKEIQINHLSEPVITNNNFEQKDALHNQKTKPYQWERQQTPKKKTASIQKSSSKKKQKIYFIKH